MEFALLRLTGGRCGVLYFSARARQAAALYVLYCTVLYSVVVCVRLLWEPGVVCRGCVVCGVGGCLVVSREGGEGRRGMGGDVPEGGDETTGGGRHKLLVLR